MMNAIQPLDSNEIDSVQGGVWQLLALVTGAVYAATEIGRALHDATCDEHESK